MKEQKHLLVSGATGNLGKIVCKTLSEKGYAMHTNYRSHESTELANLTSIYQYPADLTDADQASVFASNAVEKAGRIEAGIFLAGGFELGTIDEASQKDIEKMILTNFATAFNLVQPLKKHFEANGGGHFLFIGARPALSPQQAISSFPYTLSKSLLFQLADIINAEKKGVTASVIVPSIIDTPDNREAMPDADFEKWILPEDIAESIAFVLSQPGQKLKETILKLYNQA